MDFGGEEKKTNTKKLLGMILLACFLAVGVTLQILGCALFDNWWPLFGVFCYILAPLPSAIGGFLTKRLGGTENAIFNTQDNRHLFWVDLGIFISTFLIVSGLALPAVLLHGKQIGWPALILSECGGILVYVTISAFIYFFISPPKPKTEFY